MKSEEIHLVIDQFTPKTIPMNRLAAYLREFAALLGNEDHVHFERLKKGSTRIAVVADDEAAPKVRARLDEVIARTAPNPAMKAHHDLDDLLAADNAIGHIELRGATIIEFPGRRRPSVERIGPVRRTASIEGQIYQIGGRDETINVHLRGKSSDARAEVSIGLAQKLAPYLLGSKVRLFGEGDWYRVDSRWERARFTARDFVVLDKHDLSEAIAGISELFGDESHDEFATTMSELRNE